MEQPAPATPAPVPLTRAGTRRFRPSWAAVAAVASAPAYERTPDGASSSSSTDGAARQPARTELPPDGAHDPERKGPPQPEEPPSPALPLRPEPPRPRRALPHTPEVERPHAHARACDAALLRLGLSPHQLYRQYFQHCFALHYEYLTQPRQQQPPRREDPAAVPPADARPAAGTTQEQPRRWQCKRCARTFKQRSNCIQHFCWE